MIEEAFGEEAMSKSQSDRWHKAFREGREEVADEARSGRPSTSRDDNAIEKVRVLLNTDRRLSVRLIADQLDIPKSVVYRIVTEDFQMRKVCAKLVPKVLTDEQKTNRVTVSQELVDCCEEDPNFLDDVITGDESWMFEYDPETKRQSEEWHTSASPKPKKARMSKSKIKAMLIVFFDSKGIVHFEFLPPGQTVTAKFYVEVLKRLKQRVNRVRSEIKDSWKLHHDNAPSHTAFLTTNYLTRAGIGTVPQPPYSPDLAPPDFFLFPKVKQQLKGRHLGTLENIKTTTTRLLQSIPVQAFQDAYAAWQSRWRKCIAAGGAYFEEF